MDDVDKEIWPHGTHSTLVFGPSGRVQSSRLLLLYTPSRLPPGDFKPSRLAKGAAMKLKRAFKNPWWVVLGATLGMVVGNSPMVLFTFGLFLKPISSEFGWDRTTFATAIFVSQVVGAVSMPFIGKLVDRLGIRRVTLAFIFLF